MSCVVTFCDSRFAFNEAIHCYCNWWPQVRNLPVHQCIACLRVRSLHSTKCSILLSYLVSTCQLCSYFICLRPVDPAAAPSLLVVLYLLQGD